MIPTSKVLEQWLLHSLGELKLKPHSRLGKALELNRDCATVLSSLNGSPFALIGFVDMCGFTAMSKGKTPEQVRDIAGPFVSAIVEAARRNEWFIDKTVGDEVMLVWPLQPNEVDFEWTISIEEPQLRITMLIRDILSLSADRCPAVSFHAGFSFGQIVVAKVGGEQYSEYTVYGNAVSAAKRIQELSAKDRSPRKGSYFAVGVLDDDPSPVPEMQLRQWFDSQFSPRLWQCYSAVPLGEPQFFRSEGRGVGRLSYVVVDASISPARS